MDDNNLNTAQASPQDDSKEEFNFNDYFQQNIAGATSSSVQDQDYVQNEEEFEELMDELEETVVEPGALEYQPPAPKSAELFSISNGAEAPTIETQPIQEEQPVMETIHHVEVQKPLETQPLLEDKAQTNNTAQQPEPKVEEKAVEVEPEIIQATNKIQYKGVAVEKNVADNAEKITTIADEEEAYFIDQIHHKDDIKPDAPK